MIVFVGKVITYNLKVFCGARNVCYGWSEAVRFFVGSSKEIAKKVEVTYCLHTITIAKPSEVNTSKRFLEKDEVGSENVATLFFKNVFENK